jgi:hypothetical protein
MKRQKLLLFVVSLLVTFFSGCMLEDTHKKEMAALRQQHSLEMKQQQGKYEKQMADQRNSYEQQLAGKNDELKARELEIQRLTEEARRNIELVAARNHARGAANEPPDINLEMPSVLMTITIWLSILATVLSFIAGIVLITREGSGYSITARILSIFLGMYVFWQFLLPTGELSFQYGARFPSILKVSLLIAGFLLALFFWRVFTNKQRTVWQCVAVGVMSLLLMQGLFCAFNLRLVTAAFGAVGTLQIVSASLAGSIVYFIWHFIRRHTDLMVNLFADEERNRMKYRTPGSSVVD